MKLIIVQSGFPCGGWVVKDESGTTLRFGRQIGELPPRFKTVAAAEKAARKYLDASPTPNAK